MTDQPTMARQYFEFVQGVALLDMQKIDDGNRHELNKLEALIAEAWKWSEKLQLRSFAP